MAVDGDRALTTNMATVKIEKFNGETLTAYIQGNSGCNLKWSPDGIFLGYLNMGIPPDACFEADKIPSLTFINKLMAMQIHFS